MKSVLFLNRVYPPEHGATGQLLAELARSLAGAGWRVTVVTGSAANGTARSEWHEGVRIERVRGLPFSRRNHWKRALGYLSLYPALFWRCLRLPRPDVLVTLTDPPLQLVLGPLLQLWKKCRLLHWAQDLYPELAEEIGVTPKNGWLAGILRRLSSWALRRSDFVVAVGRCMRERMIGRGVRPDQVSVIPNWAPEGVLGPGKNGSGDLDFRKEQRWENRFVIMYSGNLGLAHRFEAIIEAAALLQERLPEALFAFVGEGPRLNWVQTEVANRKLSNVTFLPSQARERLGQTLSAADVHLASMRESLLGLVVPSKVYGVLAAGRPCVFLGPKGSEVSRVIRQYDCGSVLASTDGPALAACLTEWFFDLNRHEAAGQRARAAAAQHTLDHAAEQFSSLLNRLISDEKLGSPEPATPRSSKPPALQP
jgi:putative colanic acid biosynthesis glycosyltransferase WcaI